MLKQLLASAALAVALAKAACECGYKTNTGEIWQYAVVTDFSQLGTAAWSGDADWEVTELVREAIVNLEYTGDNVAVSDGKLQLTCSAYNASNGGTIRSGQIRTIRDDILGGSFRASYGVASGSAGSVSGFFFYANDTQEIDIEIQSKMSNTIIHIGNQPTQSTNVLLPNNGIVSELHDYRFDWLAGQTNFYLDNVPVGGFSKDVPVVNGRIDFNMWGNGGTFSGPATPTTDNVMSISKIALYFNTSSQTGSTKWAKLCKKKPACVVDAKDLNTITPKKTKKIMPTPNKTKKIKPVGQATP
ncbi:concanavalin A-like lectin/glucanase domain-containing protein [Coniochaeta sp. 2T2.1]|nr:concanavalin A-like lectin/glucanase domain-containing protein [Coniochaeta sp. 2T2.1]